MQGQLEVSHSNSTPTPVPTPAPITYRVLLVDDSGMKKMIARILLNNVAKEKGIRFEIDEASDGYEGLTKVAISICTNKPYHLTVMDYVMPVVNQIYNGIDSALAIRYLFKSEKPALNIMEFLVPADGGGIINGLQIGFTVRRLIKIKHLKSLKSARSTILAPTPTPTPTPTPSSSSSSSSSSSMEVIPSPSPKTNVKVLAPMSLTTSPEMPMKTLEPMSVTCSPETTMKTLNASTITQPATAMATADPAPTLQAIALATLQTCISKTSHTAAPIPKMTAAAQYAPRSLGFSDFFINVQPNDSHGQQAADREPLDISCFDDVIEKLPAGVKEFRKAVNKLF